MRSIKDQPRLRRGFTLIELLMVVAVVTLLVGISFVSLGNSMTLARQKATAATILKIHGLVQQRVEALNRAMDGTNLEPVMNTLNNNIKSSLNIYDDIPRKVKQILARKWIFQSRFPQSFYEHDISTSSPPRGWYSDNHLQVTESSALLYWVLTSSEIYGVPPVDESEFSSSEVRDTDGDGLMEFVDGWGHPLRFYRWPTHLFRPGTAAIAPGVQNATLPLTLTDVDRTWVNVLWSGLPAVPITVPPSLAENLGPLALDPDDPTGELRRWALDTKRGDVVQKVNFLQNRFHTPDTFHAFLIMSPGADNVLGLVEPYDSAGTAATPSSSTPLPNRFYTAPSAPDGFDPVLSSWKFTSTSPVLGSTAGQGRLASLVDHTAVENNPINDNITNRQR